MEKALAGKRVLITQATAFMGPALCEVFTAQGAEVVDLDGPLLLAEDRATPLAYDAAGVHPPEAALWG